MKYYFVDYENVHIDGLNGYEVLRKNDVICILYTDADKSFSLELLEQLTTRGALVESFKAETGSKNALDFQLSSYLGYKIAQNEASDNYFYIVSKDKGYDRVVEFWAKRGINIKRTLNLDYRKHNRNENVRTSKARHTRSNASPAPALSENSLATQSDIVDSNLVKESKIKVSETLVTDNSKLQNEEAVTREPKAPATNNDSSETITANSKSTKTIATDNEPPKTVAANNKSTKAIATNNESHEAPFSDTQNIETDNDTKAPFSDSQNIETDNDNKASVEVSSETVKASKSKNPRKRSRNYSQSKFTKDTNAQTVGSTKDTESSISDDEGSQQTKPIVKADKENITNKDIPDEGTPITDSANSKPKTKRQNRPVKRTSKKAQNNAKANNSTEESSSALEETSTT